jgi:hypothetical protein
LYICVFGLCVCVRRFVCSFLYNPTAKKWNSCCIFHILIYLTKVKHSRGNL